MKPDLRRLHSGPLTSVTTPGGEHMQRYLWIPILALVITMTQAKYTAADEGLWLFNAAPKEHLKKKYRFDEPQAWYDHVQKSSVRFNSGGSGSFVSADGLVMTNHHVGVT